MIGNVIISFSIKKYDQRGVQIIERCYFDSKVPHDFEIYSSEMVLSVLLMSI